MATSDAELHRALRDASHIRQAVNLSKVVCFFLPLFLSNKEKVESYKQEFI